MEGLMDLIDNLRALSLRLANTKDLVQTEEATKTAMVLPFIQALGYNVFDPLEVTPELTADVGTKKGEKVDYAILFNGKPTILFECKHAGDDLNIKHAGQLFRYFHVTEARFGVITNGLVYRFFSDLEQPNKMDEKPFFEFNILDFKERDVEELKKFAKSAFDLETILATATDLKYTLALQNLLNKWVVDPPEDFVRLLTTDLISNRRFTNTVREQFVVLVKRAFEQMINERINDRLKGAISINNQPVEQNTTVKKQAENSEGESDRVITTAEELEGLHIIRSLVRNVVNPRRVVLRDAQTYCAILLDDNNRKTICRLRFNNPNNLRIGFLDDNKQEEIVAIEDLDAIYKFSEQLIISIKRHI
jgi:predicted type IV restriction endonuclease